MKLFLKIKKKILLKKKLEIKTLTKHDEKKLTNKKDI